MKVRIGTRGSMLALAQSEWVKNQIESRYPHVQVELLKIKTKGDRILDSPLSRIGGKGLFVKEIEDALLNGRIDMAVHSMKDMPAILPEGLIIGAVPEREDIRDAFVSDMYDGIHELPEGALIGTSSLRRRAQILHMRPDIQVVPLRGNVDTRLRKLREGEFHAIVLASAGLRRLGREEVIKGYIPEGEILPAIGQGALAIETREDDRQIMDLIEFLDHTPTRIEVESEREFLRALEGGCQVPIGGVCRYQGSEVKIMGMVAELDGSKIIRDEIVCTPDRARESGKELAERLLLSGAGEILERIYGSERGMIQ